MTPTPARIWTALGIVYVVWGSTYLAILYVLRSAPPLLSAGVRFAAAAAILALFLVVRRGAGALAAPRRELLTAAAIGVLLLVGGNGLVSLAEEGGLPSGLTALIVAAVPFWLVLLRAGTGDRPSGGTVLGVVIGFAGVAVLLLPGARPDDVPLAAAAMAFGSSVLWSLGSFLATRVQLPGDPLVTTTVQMAGASAAFVLLGLLRGEVFRPAELSGQSWLALGYLVVFGSLVAFTAYSWLLGVAPVSKVATYAYVNPLVAVLLGAAFVGEALSAATVVGGAITVLAVAVVVAQESRRPRPTPPETASRRSTARTAGRDVGAAP